jgi:hypothetical protein
VPGLTLLLIAMLAADGPEPVILVGDSVVVIPVWVEGES